MSEPTITPDATTATPAAPVQATPAAPPAEPVYSQEYVTGLRNEAAGHRTSKNDAVAQAKAEVETEWQTKLDAAAALHTTTQGELSLSKLALLKLTKVLEAEIPSDSALAIADLVKGTDEESVSESVKTVKALLGKNPSKDSAVDPSQGSGSGVIPLNGDKVLQALTQIVSR